MHQKLVPDHFFILVNNQKQPLHARNSFENKIFWKRIIKYPLKSWHDFLLLNPVLFNGQSYRKRGLELETSRSSGYKTFSQKFIYYTLSDQVWWCNVNWFLSYYKNYTCHFMQANSWHHKLFSLLFVLLNLECEEKKGKITKNWISRERKELFIWNEKHF